MAVTRDQFDVLVRRLEGAAKQSPQLYTLRIIGLLTLAYSYLALILLGSLALIAVMVLLVIKVPNGGTIKLALIGVVAFGGIFWAVLRGLWVKLDPPEGQPVLKEQAPKLFAVLEEIRTALNCSPFHHVLLIGEHNAAVVQIPRLGVFGWHRNYLLIGLPLLQSLGPDEFKAVMAHEFAHSSRGHGRFGNWLYRMRRSWDQIFEQMAKQGSRGGFVLAKFINWFWPIFNAHAFVLARANEYEADACSVRLAGADAAANALLRLPVDGNLLSERFWPNVYDRMKNENAPPRGVLLELQHSFRSGPLPDDAARWLKQAFLIETNNSDTHPCLKDRLRAIGKLPPGVDRGEFPNPPPPPAQSAAEFYLGSHAEVAAQKLSDEWHKLVAARWAEQYAQSQKLAAELSALETDSTSPPTTDALWARAEKLLQLHGDEGAMAVVKQVLSLEPGHAGANFVCGRHHLEKDDPKGVEFLETALAENPALTPGGCDLLYGYFTRTGQRDKLRPLEERMDRFQETAALAQQERNHVTATDNFMPPELTNEQIAALQKLFAAEPDIGSAAIARKVVKHFPKSQCYVIGLRLSVSRWKLRSTGANQGLVKRVLEQIQLPGYFLVFVDEQDLKGLAKKVFAVPSAVVFERPAES